MMVIVKAKMYDVEIKAGHKYTTEFTVCAGAGVGGKWLNSSRIVIQDIL